MLRKASYTSHAQCQQSIFHVNKTAISIDNKTDPIISTNQKRPGEPLFNDDREDAIKNRKYAERQFGKHTLSNNLGNCRTFRENALRISKQNRPTSWRIFVFKFNCHTQMNKVRSMVQKKANIIKQTLVIKKYGQFSKQL